MKINEYGVRELDFTDYEELPLWMQESLLRYMEGVRPGHFLTAVLEHELFDAIGRADENSMKNLKLLVIFIYNEMPSVCHGSDIMVSTWVNRKDLAKKD